LDITGLEHLFGGEAALAERIVEEFAVQRGLTVRVAIADTLGAAWAVARFSDCKLKNENCKFAIYNLQFAICNQQSAISSSSLIVPPGQTLAALRPLPVQALRLPAQVVEALHSLGVSRIGQLEPLPRTELAARFGACIALRWDQAFGQAAEPIPASPLPAELQARESLEYPTARRDAVETILQQLIGQVARKLLGCGRGAMRLQCRLECQSPGVARLHAAQPRVGMSATCSPNASRHESMPPVVKLSVGLFEPTASAQHLLELVRLQLERLSIPAPVVGISVEVSATAPLVCHQEGLFADGPVPHRPRLLSGLIDRLASRLGRDAVVRPRLVPDAQPESAYQYEPLIAGRERTDGNGPLSLWERARVRGKRKVQSANCKVQVAKWVTSSPSPFTLHPSSFPPRPLRLFRSPRPLAAMSLVPEGPPLRFPFRGQEHRIARAWGPERIETGWWRGRSIARDYYRIETTTGRRYWLFRELDNGQWFLHGIFE
jgi:protein ImuB